MKPEDIKLGDWMRMWMGEVPPLFLLEVVVRILIIFLLLIISMRLLGLRMAAQLNRLELLALFALAAAIGVPLQVPDRGLLPAVVIAIVVVAVGRLFTYFAYRNQYFEQLITDNYAVVVKDGVLQMKDLKQTRLTVERLKQQLRSEGIRHLGEVDRLYFEAKGAFSMITASEPKPGLPVLPDFDEAFLREQKETPQMVCCTCGFTKQENTAPDQACPNCGYNQWRPGIL
jgi:uncharacterized membrane protein YcaP (DUF421 family)